MTRRLFSSFAALFAPLQKAAELTPDKDLFKNGMCPVCFHQNDTTMPPGVCAENTHSIVGGPMICDVPGRIRIDCEICSATFAVNLTPVKA